MRPDLLIDETSPPRLGEILNIVEKKPKKGEKPCIVSHIKDTYGLGSKDKVWIPKYAEDGGRFILSKDYRISCRPIEQEIIRAHGLYMFFISKTLGDKSFDQQVAFILLWWRVLKEKMKFVERENPRKGLFCKIPLKVRPKIEQLEEF